MDLCSVHEITVGSAEEVPFATATPENGQKWRMPNGDGTTRESQAKGIDI